MQDVYDHIVRVTDNIDTYRDLLSSALDSYLSLQSNHLNQIVKVLTIASIILMAGQPGHRLLRHELHQHARAALGHRQPVGARSSSSLIGGGLALYFKTPAGGSRRADPPAAAPSNAALIPVGSNRKRDDHGIVV